MKEMVLTQRILAHAAATPDKVALRMGGEQLTYGELAQKGKKQVEILSAWRKHHPAMMLSMERKNWPPLWGCWGASFRGGLMWCWTPGPPPSGRTRSSRMWRMQGLISQVLLI